MAEAFDVSSALSNEGKEGHTNGTGYKKRSKLKLVLNGKCIEFNNNAQCVSTMCLQYLKKGRK